MQPANLIVTLEAERDSALAELNAAYEGDAMFRAGFVEGCIYANSPPSEQATHPLNAKRQEWFGLRAELTRVQADLDRMARVYAAAKHVRFGEQGWQEFCRIVDAAIVAERKSETEGINGTEVDDAP